MSFTWINGYFTVKVSECVIYSCDCESLRKKEIKDIAYSKSDQSNKVGGGGAALNLVTYLSYCSKTDSMTFYHYPNNSKLISRKSYIKWFQLDSPATPPSTLPGSFHCRLTGLLVVS